MLFSLRAIVFIRLTKCNMIEVIVLNVRAIVYIYNIIPQAVVVNYDFHWFIISKIQAKQLGCNRIIDMMITMYVCT